MRNTFFLILFGMIFQISYSQYGTNNVNVTVKKDPYDFSTSINQGMQAGALEIKIVAHKKLIIID